MGQAVHQSGVVHRGLALALAAIVAVGTAVALPASSLPEVRLLFTGDILLSRQVGAEIQRTGDSPWRSLDTLFRRVDFVAGNLEGAIGAPSDCKAPELCFADPAAAAKLLADAGFRAVTAENNHAGDLGEAGRARTHEALRGAGILDVDYDDSPRFIRAGDLTIAVVAVSTVVAADGRVQRIPSVSLAQKLRLARALANVVVVSVHWGLELYDWPSPEQRSDAEWLVDHGADLVVGHHPHVVQKPGCVHGHPVFYSLGNHVFDQKYPETKRGLIADCRIRGRRLVCGSIATQTRSGSAFPTLTEGAQPNVGCAPEVHETAAMGEYVLRGAPSRADADSVLGIEMLRHGRTVWTSSTRHVVSLQTGLTGKDGEPLLLALERHPSSIDAEMGLRPYVYAVGAHGFVARWRGSALAWPLIDAVVETNGRLCALHRGDSFIRPDTTTTTTRRAEYEWDGFGFSGAVASACAD